MEMRRGQSIWEYVAVLGIVSVALIMMNIYFKRGVQGRLKDLADSQISPEQYVSGQVSAETLTQTQARSQVDLAGNTTGTTTEDTTTRTTTESSVGEGWEDLLP